MSYEFISNFNIDLKQSQRKKQTILRRRTWKTESIRHVKPTDGFSNTAGILKSMSPRLHIGKWCCWPNSRANGDCFLLKKTDLVLYRIRLQRPEHREQPVHPQHGDDECAKAADNRRGNGADQTGHRAGLKFAKLVRGADEQ